MAVDDVPKPDLTGARNTQTPLEVSGDPRPVCQEVSGGSRSVFERDPLVLRRPGATPAQCLERIVAMLEILDSRLRRVEEMVQRNPATSLVTQKKRPRNLSRRPRTGRVME